jgi:hypothetical protein
VFLYQRRKTLLLFLRERSAKLEQHIKRRKLDSTLFRKLHVEPFVINVAAGDPACFGKKVNQAQHGLFVWIFFQK